MKTKFLFISLILVVIVFTAFITSKKSSKPEYALLKNTISLMGIKVEFIYGNGVTEDLAKKLNLNLGTSPIENFPEMVKIINYLNEKGYKILSYSFTNFSGGNTSSYLFIKE